MTWHGMTAVVPVYSPHTHRVNEHMMKEYLYPSGEDTVALMCGPPAMIEYGCIPGLEAIGYTEENLVEF